MGNILIVGGAGYIGSQTNMLLSKSGFKTVVFDNLSTGYLRLARNRFIPVGNGLNRRTLVYDKDVGFAAVLAISHPAAAGRVFNVTDGEFHTLTEIIGTICAALGHKPPRVTLPVGPCRLLAGSIEMGCRALGLTPPVSRAMIDKYTEDIAVSGSLIKQELGFSPKYSLKAGWEETIKEMREGGVVR